MKDCRDIEEYFYGDILWGDDFSLDEIKEWFDDEKEGYTSLYMTGENDEEYAYDELNKFHSFRFLPLDRKYKALGMGAASGDEFSPIVNLLKDVVIVEPSSRYDGRRIVHGVEAKWVKPNITGVIDLPDQSVDLVTCFGALHHIPNVTFVLKEMARVLRPGGYMLIREPMMSMGDWRRPRPGLTKRERGIPRSIFKNTFHDVGLYVVHESFSSFPVVDNLRVGSGLKYSAWFVILDAVLSRLFIWNNWYHRDNIFKKLAPRNVHFVVKKYS